MSDSPGQERAVSQIYDARERALQGMMAASSAASGDAGPLVRPGYEGPLDGANVALKNYILTVGDVNANPESWTSESPIVKIDLPREQGRPSARRNSNEISYTRQRDQPQVVAPTTLTEIAEWMHRTVIYRNPPAPSPYKEMTLPDGRKTTIPRDESPPPIEDQMRMVLLFPAAALEQIFRRVDAAVQELGLGIDIEAGRNRDGSGF